MKTYPHGCDADHEYEEIAKAKRLAHENFECEPPCDDCEAEAADKAKPVCQDCGEKALPGYVAGDRCERCGGRLDMEAKGDE